MKIASETDGLSLKSIVDQLLLWLGFLAVTAVMLVGFGFAMKVYSFFFLFGWGLI